MYLLLYIGCAVAGTGAIVAFSNKANSLRERSFAAYAVLIGALMLPS